MPIEETTKSRFQAVFFFFLLSLLENKKSGFAFLLVFVVLFLKPGFLFIPKRIHHKKELKLKSF